MPNVWFRLIGGVFNLTPMAIKKISNQDESKFLPWVNEWVEKLSKSELKESLDTVYYIYQYKFTDKGVIMEIPNRFSCFAFKSSQVYKELHSRKELLPDLSDLALTDAKLTMTQSELTKLLKDVPTDVTDAPCICIQETKPYFQLAFDDECFHLPIARLKEKGWIGVQAHTERKPLNELKKEKVIELTFYPHKGATKPLS